MGAYAAGNDPQLDEAIARYPRLEAYLQQDIGENIGYDDAVNQLRASFELRDTYA
ncbi:Flagellum-specific ATP synthase [compost metagenome]